MDWDRADSSKESIAANAEDYGPLSGRKCAASVTRGRRLIQCVALQNCHCEWALEAVGCHLTMPNGIVVIDEYRMYALCPERKGC